MLAQLKKTFRRDLALPQRQEKEVFATHCAELNELAGGGLPRSAIVEISGRAAGRTALVYSALGAALAEGGVCAYVDATNSFDPVSAGDAGLDLSRLIWARGSGKLENSIKAADALLHAGGFSVLVLDVADMTREELYRIPQSFWFRSQRIVERQPATLIVVSKDHITGTCADLVVRCKSSRPVFMGSSKNVLKELKLDIEITRPAPARGSSVLLKSRFWSEKKDVCGHSYSFV
jgi:recA bacterial DNA recombination protein